MRIEYCMCCVCAKSLQSCPTLCDPVDCSLPGSSVDRILQAKILEWVAISFSRGSSKPRDQTHISIFPALAGRFFTTSTTWEALRQIYYPQIYRLPHLGSQLLRSRELWLQENRKCHWVEDGIDPFGSNVDRGSSMAS